MNAGAERTGAPRRGRSRHTDRTRALEILFEADVTDKPIAVVLAAHEQGDEPPHPFALELVTAVTAHRSEVDAIIRRRARGWSLERMPFVDRNVLRLALVELLYGDVPPKVAIDEAVELAKSLSTDDSPAFVNGVLASEARDRGLL